MLTALILSESVAFARSQLGRTYTIFHNNASKCEVLVSRQNIEEDTILTGSIPKFADVPEDLYLVLSPENRRKVIEKCSDGYKFAIKEVNGVDGHEFPTRKGKRKGQLWLCFRAVHLVNSEDELEVPIFSPNLIQDLPIVPVEHLSFDCETTLTPEQQQEWCLLDEGLKNKCRSYEISVSSEVVEIASGEPDVTSLHAPITALHSDALPFDFTITQGRVSHFLGLLTKIKHHASIKLNFSPNVLRVDVGQYRLWIPNISRKIKKKGRVFQPLVWDFLERD